MEENCYQYRGAAIQLFLKYKNSRGDKTIVNVKYIDYKRQANLRQLQLTVTNENLMIGICLTFCFPKDVHRVAYKQALP